MNLFDASRAFPGFDYPEGLKRVARLELVDLDYWFIMEAAFAERYCASMGKRYPNRALIPFAKRTDCDDVACFEIGKPGKVQIIHDFAAPGWEQRAVYDDFWSWFQDAISVLVTKAQEEESNEP